MKTKTRGPQKGAKYTDAHRHPFGRALAAERRKRGYTQLELAQLIGTSKRVVSHLEREVKNPPADTLKKLTAGLRIPVGRLLFADGKEPLDAAAVDRALSKRLEAAQKLPPTARSEIKKFIDMVSKANGVAA